MIKEKLEKEATEFEENYTVYEVAKRKDGTDYAKKVCKVTVKEAYLAGAEPREKRIADLEQKLEQAEKDLADYQFNYPTIKEVQKENTELEKELVELKKRNGVLAGQKASLGRWLGEAIAVIKKFSEFLNSKVEYDPEHSQEHTALWNELCERAERFLKEFIPSEV